MYIVVLLKSILQIQIYDIYGMDNNIKRANRYVHKLYSLFVLHHFCRGIFVLFFWGFFRLEEKI